VYRRMQDAVNLPRWGAAVLRHYKEPFPPFECCSRRFVNSFSFKDNAVDFRRFRPDRENRRKSGVNRMKQGCGPKKSSKILLTHYTG
jgi:hypothetical protein